MSVGASVRGGVDVAELDSLRERFTDVGARRVAPSVATRAARSREGAGPHDPALWQALGEEGLFSLSGIARRAAAIEGLARGSLDLGLAVSVCAHYVVIAVLERAGGHDDVLERLRAGTALAACANAEASAGTDLMGLKSRCRFVDGGGFSLSARKRSVTNVGACDVALVSARVHGVPPREAINVFVVDAKGPRVCQRARTELSGLQTSPTGSLLAWRAPLPAQALVGARGDGVRLFRHMFSEERITTAFLYLAALKACRDRALQHAETRKQFGQPIGRNQYVQDKIVRMEVALELLEAHLWSVVDDYAAVTADDGEVDGRLHASLSVAKVHGIEAALQAAQDTVRLLGARGVSSEEPVERVQRDLLALSILGGTVELQKIAIYNELARTRLGRSPSSMVPSPVPVVRLDGGALSPETCAGLTALVRAAQPDEPPLRHGWYWDTRPDEVLLVQGPRGPVGLRTIVWRDIVLGARTVLVAGTGAVVAPDAPPGTWDVLLSASLARARERGAALVCCFAPPARTEERLRAHGFRRLRVPVTSLDGDTGALVHERAPCLVLGLGGAVVDEIEAWGALHLGVGTW